MTYQIQEELNAATQFVDPEIMENKYKLMMNEIKETGKNLISKKNNLRAKWNNLTVLPVALFYLSGLSAYATPDKVEDKIDKPDYVGPALMASTTAGTSANSGEDDFDGEEFVTLWFTSFTTLLEN